jgi:hypothetical protein
MVNSVPGMETDTYERPSEEPVSQRRFIRLSGFMLLVGGVLWFLAETGWGLFVLDAGDPSEYPQPLASILWVVVLVALISMLVGVPGLHVYQASRNSTLGVIGLIVLSAGLVLMAGLAYFGAFLQEAVAGLIVEAEEAGLSVEEPASATIGYVAAYGLHFIGWVVFGIAALRARVLPRWAVVLAMVGSLAMVIVGLPLLTAAGVVWLGLVLVRIERSRSQHSVTETRS